MRLPLTKDLYCYRGQTYDQSLYFKQGGEPYSLEGITVRAHIRPYENSTRLLAEINCLVSAEEGRIRMTLSDEETAKLKPGKYSWDLRANDGTRTQYWIKGKFIVDGRTTI